MQTEFLRQSRAGSEHRSQTMPDPAKNGPAVIRQNTAETLLDYGRFCRKTWGHFDVAPHISRCVFCACKIYGSVFSSFQVFFTFPTCTPNFGKELVFVYLFVLFSFNSRAAGDFERCTVKCPDKFTFGEPVKSCHKRL